MRNEIIGQYMTHSEMGMCMRDVSGCMGYVHEMIMICVYVFVGSCLATKVFIGNLPAMGRGWVIIK